MKRKLCEGNERGRKKVKLSLLIVCVMDQNYKCWQWVEEKLNRTNWKLEDQIKPNGKG